MDRLAVASVPPVRKTYALLGVAVAIFIANTLWALSMIGDVPGKAYGYSLVVPAAILILGRFRLRLAFWILLVMEAIIIPVQFLPPIEVWRYGVAAIDGAVALIAIRGLAATQSSRVASSAKRSEMTTDE